MTEFVVSHRAAPPLIRAADISAKACLVVLLVAAMIDQDAAHLREKGAEARAVTYPLLSFTLPVVWLLWWRDRAPFPWLADLLVTVTCFTDTFGNRLNLYETVAWFDDWMHFMNVGLLVAAVVMLTLRPSSSRGRVVDRAVAFGATAAIGWEIGEFLAYLHRGTGRGHAYADTLADLGFGVLGAVVAALAVHALWQRGMLRDAGFLEEASTPRAAAPGA